MRKSRKVQLSVLLVLCIPAGCFTARLVWKNWGTRVLVFPEGIVRVRHGTVETALWDEVEAVALHPRTGELAALMSLFHELRVRLRGRPELVFDDYLPDLRKLYQLVAERTFTPLLSRALAGFAAGNTVPFGALSLTRDGVSVCGRSLPWGEVADFTVGESIIIRQKGVARIWAVYPAEYLINGHILPALIRQVWKPPDGE